MKKMNDSAQLILIAGFTIGLAIVVSTVMLNNIIFASNMASESSIDANRYYISNTRQMASDAFSGAYYNAIRNQSSLNETLFNQYMSSYNRNAASVYALSGVSFNIDNGTLYDAYFTENGLSDGEPDWVVMAGINSTDSFMITMNTSFIGNETNAFTIQAINQSNITLWSIMLYDNSGINITAYDQTMSVLGTDTSSSALVFLNITNNSIDGDIFNFDIADQTINETYKLKILNGTNAFGVFSISGDLVSGTSFSRVRYAMANATVSISSGNTKINISIPISIP